VYPGCWPANAWFALSLQVKNANIGDKTISSDRLQGGDMNPSVSFSNVNVASGMSRGDEANGAFVGNNGGSAA
jgi:hypothetical protein